MTAADFTNLHLQYKSEQAEGEVPAAIEHDFDAGRMVDHYFVTPSPAFWEDEGIRGLGQVAGIGRCPLENPGARTGHDQRGHL